MRIPGADQAIILPEKLRDYLLNPEHPRGKTKAVYLNVLGYQQDNWERLEADLRGQHLPLEVFRQVETRWGTRFILVGPLSGPVGTGRIVSVWEIRPGEDAPRFLSAYPGGRRWQSSS